MASLSFATMASLSFATTAQPMLSSSRTEALNRTLASCSPRASLSTNFASPYVAGSVAGGFSGQKILPASLNPYSSSPSGSRSKRSVITMVIPFKRGSAREQPPPDLASHLFRQRIIYLGMPLVPSVVELMIAEFQYLEYEDIKKPIYLYINSVGTSKGNRKFGDEQQGLAIYDFVSLVVPPVYTLCVGNAWGEAALLLAAGSKGHRAALPSSTIMMRQPIARIQGRATEVDNIRKFTKSVKADLVSMYAKEIGKSPEVIEADIRRPKYFSPSEAVEYGIIDRILYTEKSGEVTDNRGLVSDMKQTQLFF